MPLPPFAAPATPRDFAARSCTLPNLLGRHKDRPRSAAEKTKHEGTAHHAWVYGPSPRGLRGQSADGCRQGSNFAPRMASRRLSTSMRCGASAQQPRLLLHLNTAQTVPAHPPHWHADPTRSPAPAHLPCRTRLMRAPCTKPQPARLTTRWNRNGANRRRTCPPNVWGRVCQRPRPPARAEICMKAHSVIQSQCSIDSN